MAVRRLTTGFPQLDEYIGGIQSGESVLLLIPSGSIWNDIVQTLTRSDKITSLKYISIRNSLYSNVSANKKFQLFSTQEKKITTTVLLRRIQKFLSQKPSGATIVLDELSLWKDVLKSERHLVTFYQSLLKNVERRKGITLTSVLKPAFSMHSLAVLKDASSVCFEFVQHREKLFLFPLHIKNRYKPGHIFPIALHSIDQLSKTSFDTSSEITEASIERRVENLATAFAPPEDRYTRVFHQMTIPSVLFHVYGTYREFNAEAVQFLGRTPDELLIAGVPSFVESHERFRLLRALLEIRKKKSLKLEFEIQTGKRVIPAVVHFQNLGGGMVLVSWNDLSSSRTLQKHLHRTKEDFSNFLQSQKFPLLVLDGLELKFLNSPARILFHIESETGHIQKRLPDLCTPQSLKILRKILREKDTSTMQLELITGSERSIHCLASTSSVIFEGKLCVALLLIDISSMKENIERLSTSEFMYRSLVEQSPQAIALVEKGLIQQCNQALLEMFGFSSSDQIIGKEYALLASESSGDWFSVKATRRAAARNGTMIHEVLARKTDGTTFDVLISVRPFPDASERFIFFCEDVTQRKRTAYELKQRTREVSLLREIHHTVQSTIDIQHLLRSSLHELMNILNWDIGAIYLLHEESKEFRCESYRHLSRELLQQLQTLPLEAGIGGFLNKTQEPHQFYVDRYPSHLPFRSLFKSQQLHTISFTPLISGERVNGIVFLASKSPLHESLFSSDLLSVIGRQLGAAIANTRVFQKLNEVRERFVHVMSTSSAVHYVLAANGVFEFVSGSIELLLGYAPKEFQRNKSLWLSITHPDDKRILLERTAHLNEIETRSVSEYRMLPRGKSSHKWICDTVTVEKDTQGIVLRLIGTLTDVSEHHNQEDNLLHRSQLMTAMLDGLDVGIATFDSNLVCTYWNETMENLLGISAGTAINAFAVKVLPDVEGAEPIKALLGRALSGEPSVLALSRQENRKTKTVCWLSLRFSPLTESGNVRHGVMCTILDMSTQKHQEEHLRESEHKLRSQIESLRTLYGETLHISQELQKQNRELNDFAHMVSHDLKEPLINIVEFCRILQMDYADIIQSEGKSYLDSIVRATARMKDLIDNLLLLSHVGRSSEAFQAVLVSDIISDIRTEMAFTIRQRGVQLIVPEDLPTVWGNEAQLKIVFRNLIGNAIKFNTKLNPMVEIGFRIAENNSYLFSIRDNGIGIEKEFFEKIFVIFQRLHRHEEFVGSGVGLALVKKIMENHKGTIWVESEIGRGSTFSFTLPKTKL